MNFIDLQEQYKRYKKEIDAEIAGVLDSARFIMGPVLTEFEDALAEHSGAKYAIGCASGTDAILLALMALGVRPGDEVIVPDFTFFATAEVVSFLRAKPIFVDVLEDTYNINPALVEEKITDRTRGIIAVSLFGQCADFDELHEIAEKHNLFLLEDAAQSYGALYKGKKSCSLTEMATTSFFPAKPLGAYGDGGAVFTSNNELADKVRMLLNHGQNERYRHRYIGINGRLDAIQAAVLKVKLKHFDTELELRQQVADKYSEALKGFVVIPTIKQGNVSVWAQYTVRSDKREKVIEHLKSKGIPTAIHYPIPLHQQEAFSYLEAKDSDFPVANRISQEVFSLPMHPFMTDMDIQTVIDAIKEAL